MPNTNTQSVDIAPYAEQIMRSIPKGVLLTTKLGDKVNTMTIGWGTLGFEWATPVFTAFVREGRFTNQMLQEHGEFTINVPYGEYDRSILGLCGSRSGRDHDKIAEAGLTLVEPRVIGVPAIQEFPLTLECRVVYAKLQDLSLLDQRFMNFYPQDVDSSAPGANRDAHVAYYGEVVAAYIVGE